MISLLFPFTANALSATTAQVIEGTAPYLTFDNGKTKATTTGELLGMTIKNGEDTKTYTKNSDSSQSSPIELPVTDMKFSEIQTLVLSPSENSAWPKITLQELITGHNYWGDDDGDHTPSVVPANSDITVKWEDDTKTDITDWVKTNINEPVSVCSDYYKLTLTSTAGTLSTSYGKPKDTAFTADSRIYYIKAKPPTIPHTCFAQPNLQYGDDTGNAPNGWSGQKFAGPVTQWNPSKGFKPQNINVPSSNFPTMGSDKLFFNLTIAGAEGGTVQSTKVSGGSPNVSITLSEASGNKVKITLNGPSTASQGAFIPTTFELYSGATKIYSFTLTKWFIARKGIYTNGYDAPIFCNNLFPTGNYRVPLGSDYTNSIAIGTGYSYTRTIGGGLLAEWGNISPEYYVDNDWNAAGHWISDLYHTVASNTGAIIYSSPSEINRRVACVMP